MDEKREIPPLSDLAEWVEQVEQGGSIELTREGKSVAKIVPMEKRKLVPPTWEELKDFRRSLDLKPDEMSIKDMINYGRKR